MRRFAMLRRKALLLLLVVQAAEGCVGDGACTEIGCESRVSVDYGLAVGEPYTLYIDPNGTLVAAVCLGEPTDEPVPPDWLECDSTGFTITGPEADLLTIVSVTVIPISTEEALIENELVTLITDEVLQPNGSECEPTCYERSGGVGP